MKDLELAKELLESNQLALAIVKNGKTLFVSHDRGIKPLYQAINEMKEQLKGSSVADRVVGRAAAMLYQFAEIKGLFADLLSETAINVLNDTKIIYDGKEVVPYIKNWDKTDLCPIEKLSLNVEDIDKLLENIGIFLENIKKQ